LTGKDKRRVPPRRVAADVPLEQPGGARVVTRGEMTGRSLRSGVGTVRAVHRGEGRTCCRYCVHFTNMSGYQMYAKRDASRRADLAYILPEG
jgi:hypothetical protein